MTMHHANTIFSLCFFLIVKEQSVKSLEPYKAIHTLHRPDSRQTRATHESPCTVRRAETSEQTRPHGPLAQTTSTLHTGLLVEDDGIEPTTPCLQSRCSPS